MARVYLENITKVFDGTVVAVDDLTLEVPDRGLVSLLGPSGCGKTTTMRIISGLETPTSGRVYFDDQDFTDITARHRDVTMVFQFPVLYPSMSIYDNISFPLVAQGLSRDEIRRRVEEVSALFGLSGFLYRGATELDAGDKQRAVLARAFIRRPRVYLLDKPLTNVDPKARLDLRSELKRMQIDLGQTMIYVTHDQSEALTLADRIAVMDKGRLLQYDSPENIYRYPASTFVAWFIGNPGMNFLDCKVTERDGRAFLNVGGLERPAERLVPKLGTGRLAREFILGIRPEHIEVGLEEGADYFPATCNFVEPMGNRQILHLVVGGQSIKAKAVGSKRTLKGERVWVRFPPEEIRVFDSLTHELVV
ncbi:MAG: ABC transporter ATP-binding protein [Deltaproteobacteria bacterium]|nr:ABC transporter ATP-binding protein [Deltaproteobacteria bacterium]